jgi:hypothetical protein
MIDVGDCSAFTIAMLGSRGALALGTVPKDLVPEIFIANQFHNSYRDPSSLRSLPCDSGFTRA